MIRAYRESDIDAIKRIHRASGLPETCFPPLQSANCIVKVVAEDSQGITQAGFVKLTGEAFVLVDHSRRSSQERWETLQRLVARGLKDSADYGIDDVSAWIPPEIEPSFGKRLEALGWIRSPWRNYTALLR